MAMPNESEMDNILVHQKNNILWAINHMETQGDYFTILAQIQLLAELWDKYEYGYKTAELRMRLIEQSKTLNIMV